MPATPASPASPTVCPTDYLFSSFNIFSFGSITLFGSDFEGRVAAGGSVSLTNFSVGAYLEGGSSVDCSAITGYQYALVSAGSVTLNRGAVVAGKVAYGNSISSTAVNYNSGCGNAIQDANVIDFNYWKTYAMELSMKISQLTGTGSVTSNNGICSMVGTGASTEIFNVEASVFQACKAFSVAGVSSAGSIVVNVMNGGSIELPVADWSPFEQYREKLIFNFYGTTQISFHNIAFHGVLIAPSADLSTYSGQYNGQIIVNSWSGSAQGNVRTISSCPPLLVSMDAGAGAARSHSKRSRLAEILHF